MHRLTITERPDIPDVEWFADGTGAYSSRTLSREEICRIEQYFAAIYGIQLEQQGPDTCTG
jgi:hypothetical protein